MITRPSNIQQFDAAQRHRIVEWTTIGYNILGVSHGRQGELGECLRYLDLAEETSPNDPRPIGALANYYVQQGDSDRGFEYVERMYGLARNSPPGAAETTAFVSVVAEIAVTTDSSDWLERAEELAREALASDLVTMRRSLVLLSRSVINAELGNHEAATSYYGQFREHGGIIDRAITSSVYGNRILLYAKNAFDEPDEVISWISDWMPKLRVVGGIAALPWLAYYGSKAYLRRDQPGDSEKATELQDEAIAITTELGMTPLLERVLAQRDILKA